MARSVMEASIAGKEKQRRSWNPFRITGTPLHPSLLLAAKLIVVAMLLLGRELRLSDHFLPFFGFFDHLGSPLVFHRALQAAFLLSSGALLFNRAVRGASSTLGLVLLMSILSSRIYWSNNITYTALVLILIGLSDRTERVPLVRLQVILLYFGAALNKLLERDWLSGQFMNHWALTSSLAGVYGRVSSLLPGMALAALLGWLVIATEFALVVGFAVRRLFAYAIWLGIAYHTALLAITGRTFGMFYFALPASFLAFVTWPQAPRTVLHGARHRRLRRFLQRIDVEDAFMWQETDVDRLRFGDGDRPVTGWPALRTILLANPVTAFVLVTLIAAPEPGGLNLRRFIAPVLLLAFTPFETVLHHRRRTREGSRSPVRAFA